MVFERFDACDHVAKADRLALWALKRYAPIVAADPPDGLVIDVSGAAHLHGGEAAILDDETRRNADARDRGAATMRALYARGRCEKSAIGKKSVRGS